MKATPIPAKSREVVKTRAAGRCEGCGCPTQSAEWHHRRSRSIRDDLTHSPCNGISLCPTCHRKAHSEPAWARATGWIVSRYEDDPALASFKRWDGWVYLKSDGSVEWL